ncbi:MAG: Bor family protein [Myxococcota bacterium]|nr:Bor family protein [Myxococcota bacterium]MDW8363348.1 hypothetical protein [Myxococcales bacterium]
MPRASRLAILLGIALLGGCWRHPYVVAGVPVGPSMRLWRHHFVFGLVHAQDEIELRTVCPQGIARIENRVGLPQAVLGVLTLGVYTPSESIVTCQALQGAAGESGAGQGQATTSHASDARPDQAAR